ncbi:LOW QUALITY PROTEIN: hypothetical protein Cgig2_032117 [Carnegiea gigantea]|uniref:Uncharacterized protein n=1 Tax=Carnegiea gigantea TaxID=171969 RepID=A0A9Q1QJR3_9CARY|nr:LOW QUALITY PROTEIN: hypothetical protein Cgig2_032117 [Carnegiea gigantea]
MPASITPARAPCFSTLTLPSSSRVWSALVGGDRRRGSGGHVVVSPFGSWLEVPAWSEIDPSIRGLPKLEIPGMRPKEAQGHQSISTRCKSLSKQSNGNIRTESLNHGDKRPNPVQPSSTLLNDVAMGICKRKAEPSMLDMVLREKLDEITLVYIITKN